MARPGPKPRPVLERLAAKSQADGECLVWTGRVDSDGYGQVKVDGRTTPAHRAAWMARYGAIPAETPLVLHHCDNPPCFRDDHLWLGTSLDNVRDMVAKGRQRGAGATHCKRGHPLTDANVRRTRDSYHCRPCANLLQRQRYALRRECLVNA